MTSIEFYERDTVIKRIGDNLNQINQRYFEGNHGILSVTDNGDYVTVKRQGLSVADYDTQKLFDALENFSQEDREFLFPYGLWDYLDHCKYTPQEDQRSDNQLKTDNELSFSEKRQVALVDLLLSEPDEVDCLLSEPDLEYQEFNKAWIEKEALKQRIHDLECTVSLLQKETDQITVLNESVTQLHTRIYQLEQENKQLKSSQLEDKPEPKSDKKPTAKKSKFKLPENFADYQQECDDLIDALSCFYNIKKGKWGKDILQFILTPNDTEKAKHPYPDKWKAGLYFSRRWAVDKVNLSDPDEWSDWYMDIYDFADANDLEIS
jgi:uncharacterized coiled-coil protein SlyX